MLEATQKPTLATVSSQPVEAAGVLVQATSDNIRYTLSVRGSRPTAATTTSQHINILLGWEAAA